MNQITDSNLLDQRVKEYNKEVTDLWDKLMALELQLVDQFEVHFLHTSNMSLYHSLSSQLCPVIEEHNHLGCLLDGAQI